YRIVNAQPVRHCLTKHGHTLPDQISGIGEQGGALASSEFAQLAPIHSQLPVEGIEAWWDRTKWLHDVSVPSRAIRCSSARSIFPLGLRGILSTQAISAGCMKLGKSRF